MQNPIEILKKYWGYDSFRYPQDGIIQSVLEGKDVLALMPTGGGKSITFQVPALVKEGICLVISPLIALMTDQVENLKNKGIKALSIAGGISYADLERLLNNATFGGYKFLYMSPERLQQDVVRTFIKSMNINLIAIDEAHCVSHWGKDFRPAYLECKWLKETFPNVPMLALTASATPKVQQDIVEQLGMQHAETVATSLKRPNIAYKVLKAENKWLQLQRILKKEQGSAIVYVRSRNGTIRMSEYLQEFGISATFFHGGLSSDEKNKKLSYWLLNDVRVMVATSAFGMGIDKPDVRTVIHWDIPPTLEDYFQEAGRAGRDGKKAEALLLYDDASLENAKQQLLNQLTDIPYLKFLYTKLNSYFQIAYGEGLEMRFYFQFSDFCKKYGLNYQKAYNGLTLLDRLSVIALSQNFHNKAVLHFKASSYEVINYLKNKPLYKDVVFFLLRNYPGIYERELTIDVGKIADKMGEKTTSIEKQFEALQKDEVITYKAQSTDAELVFKKQRDDDRTINAVAKNVREYNETKINLQNTVFDYIENTNTCRSVQLLKYFGENEAIPCGICSVCATKQLTSIQEIKLEIRSLLAVKSKTFTDLVAVLPYQENEILNALDELVEFAEIKINTLNEYCLS